MREELDKLKNMDAGHKLGYIWDYYKVPIIAAVVIIIAVTSMIHTRLTTKKVVLKVAMLDSQAYYASDSSLLDGFAGSLQGFDEEKERIVVDASYNSGLGGQVGFAFMEKIVADYSAGIIDATIAPREDILKYAEHQAYGDLKQLLPADLYAGIEDMGCDFIFYTYEDPATGEKHEYPAAVNISGSDAIKAGFTDMEGNIRAFYDTDCYYAISPDTPNKDNCIAFLRYLLEQ